MSRSNDRKFIVKHIVKNYKRWLKNTLGKISVSNGATHFGKSVEESIEYIFQVFNDYLIYGNLSDKNLEEKTILEIGPGDNLGVALLFIAKGAKKVYTIDKYFSERIQSDEVKIYKAIRERLKDDERIRFDNAITLEEKDFKLNKDKIESIYGKSLEEIKSKSLNNYFDMIVSRAVLQVVNHLDRLFRKMNDCLKIGGIMLHKVDLRDYGTFTKYKNHELGNLMFSDFIYTQMTNHSSIPNRKRINEYQKIVANYQYHDKYYITHIFGNEEKVFDPHQLELKEGMDYDNSHLEYIKQVKPLLFPKYRSYSDLDLLISGFFMVAKKYG